MSTVGTDARERLWFKIADTLEDVRDDETKPSAASAILDALLSEGCRGDLAEAAGLPDWDQVATLQSHLRGAERLLRDARRETALKIAGAIRAEMDKPIMVHQTRTGLVRAEAIARSFTEESSEPCLHIAQSFGHKMCMTCGATLEDQPLTIDRSVVERATPDLYSVIRHRTEQHPNGGDCVNCRDEESTDGEA